jgi:hypothetical protein
METDSLKPEHWRKSSQWIALMRRHAVLMVQDTHVSAQFERYALHDLASYQLSFGSFNLMDARSGHGSGQQDDMDVFSHINSGLCVQVARRLRGVWDMPEHHESRACTSCDQAVITINSGSCVHVASAGRARQRADCGVSRLARQKMKRVNTRKEHWESSPDGVLGVYQPLSSVKPYEIWSTQ